MAASAELLSGSSVEERPFRALDTQMRAALAPERTVRYLICTNSSAVFTLGVGSLGRWGSRHESKIET